MNWNACWSVWSGLKRDSSGNRILHFGSKWENLYGLKLLLSSTIYVYIYKFWDCAGIAKLKISFNINLLVWKNSRKTCQTENQLNHPEYIYILYTKKNVWVCLFMCINELVMWMHFESQVLKQFTCKMRWVNTEQREIKACRALNRLTWHVLYKSATFESLYQRIKWILVDFNRIFQQLYFSFITSDWINKVDNIATTSFMLWWATKIPILL